MLPEEEHPKATIPKSPSQAGMSQLPDSLELPRGTQGTGQIWLLSYSGPTSSSYS